MNTSGTMARSTRCTQRMFGDVCEVMGGSWHDFERACEFPRGSFDDINRVLCCGRRGCRLLPRLFALL